MAVTKKLPFWEFLLICLCTVYFIVPTVPAMFPFYAILFIEFIYSAYLVFSGKVNGFSFIKILALVLCVALLYTFLNDIKSIDVYASNRLLKRFISKFTQYSCMFFPILFFKRFIDSGSYKQARFIILLSIISFIGASIPVLQLISIDPLAARDFGLEEGGNFIAPFPFVYGMTFVLVGAFLCLWNSNNKSSVFKWSTLVLFLFSLFFLYKSQFTLSLITSLITVVYIITRALRSSGTRLVFVISVFLVVLIMPYILEYLVIPFMPDLLASRFEEVRSFFLGDIDVESDLYGRFDLYGKSIKAFLNSPFIGNRSLDFDGHATYLMVWADLGLLGGSLVFYLLFKAKSIVNGLLSSTCYLFIPVFVHLFLNGFTNPIHASLQIYICIWFLIPLSLYTFQDNLSFRKRIH